MTDVFISYSHKDHEWVRNVLLPMLEQHAFSVLIDYRDFKAGRFSVEEMERCVLQARHVLLVLTPDYVNSEWATFENVMGQTLDPAAIKRKLVPLLRVDCDIPLRISIIHYRDLRSDDQEQWELLYRDLTN